MARNKTKKKSYKIRRMKMKILSFTAINTLILFGIGAILMVSGYFADRVLLYNPIEDKMVITFFIGDSGLFIAGIVLASFFVAFLLGILLYLGIREYADRIKDLVDSIKDVKALKVEECKEEEKRKLKEIEKENVG